MVVKSIPIVDFADFGTNPKKVAQDVFEACKTIGFFYVVNHGLAQSAIDRAFDLSKEFFDLPEEEKKKYTITSKNHGYSYLYSETLDPEHQKQGDHKEGFNFRNFEYGKPFAPLPPVFDENKDFIEEFSRGCHKTALQILEAFAIALEIPEDKDGKHFFAKYHNYEGSAEVLRFLKYPRGGQTNYKETIRAGAHSDYGSITLLFQKDIPGLEVQAGRTEWISAPILADRNAIIVNVGDQMELWTNGLFKSTKHRVTFLPEHGKLDRYSIPFFAQPNDNALLKPVPSKFVKQGEEGHIFTSGEYLERKLDATYFFEDKKVHGTSV